MRRRQRPEQQIHKSVVAHLKARGVADVVFLHPANGMARSPIEGALHRARLTCSYGTAANRLRSN
jgi:hypothetical protein